MRINIKGKIDDISAMLLSAERYALGRQTYIVNWTCEFLSKNLHLISDRDKLIMIRDIEQCENYGWKCDKEDWLKLLKSLKESGIPKQPANTDTTYCTSKDCKNKCWRHEDNHEFLKGAFYSFMEKCENYEQKV